MIGKNLSIIGQGLIQNKSIEFLNNLIDDESTIYAGKLFQLFIEWIVKNCTLERYLACGL